MIGFDVFAGTRGRVAAGLLVAEFTAATQSLVVTTVMPRIAADLHGIGLYGFAYAALFGASLLSMTFAGPAADRYGIARTLVAAYALSLAGLLGSMLAPSMPSFIAARAVEGFGGGLDYVVSIAAIAKLFPEELRPRMFAWISAMWVVPGLIGPGLGALIAASFGWRAVFGSFVPLLVVSGVLVLPAVRAMNAMTREGDPLGAIRLLLSRQTLLLRDEHSVPIWAFAALNAAFVGADAFVSLMLTNLRGFSLGGAGLCITLAVLGWTLASSAQPRISERTGPRALVVAGAVLTIAGIGGMLGVVFGLSSAWAFASWAITGIGVGLSYSTLTLSAMAGWPEGGEGAGSSATLVAGQLGAGAGVAICGIPITLAHHGGGSLAAALARTFTIAGAFAVALLALSMRLSPKKR